MSSVKDVRLYCNSRSILTKLVTLNEHSCHIPYSIRKFCTASNINSQYNLVEPTSYPQLVLFLNRYSNITTIKTYILQQR